MGKVIRNFYWHQNFVPKGLSVPALGLYICIQSFKMCLKSYFKDMVGKVIRAFSWHQHLSPRGCLPLPWGYIHVYWAKVLTIHPKKCDYVFVVQYFGMNFGTFNENTVWHQLCSSAGIWHSACSLHMRLNIKPLKCMCNSRNDLNLNSNHRNLNNNVVS